MKAFAYRLAAAVVLALVLSVPVVARDCRPQVREGWVRMPPGGMSTKAMPMMAGFGRIVNHCSTPATIVSARSPSFGSVELHETRVVDGVSKMRPVPSLRLAPDGAAILRPGGMHLMLMRPGATLKAGSRIVIEFELADGGKLLGEFEVRKPEL
ncbi:MAG: copper chaperone PCu(A)C [Lysobacteraceae bacterium]